MHSLIHSLSMHSFIHAFTHSCFYSFIHLLIQAFTHLFMHSLTCYPYIQSIMHLLILAFTFSCIFFIYLCSHLYIHSFMHSLTHVITHHSFTHDLLCQERGLETLMKKGNGSSEFNAQREGAEDSSSLGSRQRSLAPDW